MKQQVRQLVKKRDNYNCRNCHTKDNLEVHHIISKEECDLMGVVDKELKKILDSPDYLITLCVDCHSTTFFSSARPHLLTPYEKDELESITRKWKQLELDRKVLKKKYHNLWNAESYKNQKHIIDKSFEELDERRKEIRKSARIRLHNRRQEVIKLCDEQLLRVVDQNKQPFQKSLQFFKHRHIVYYKILNYL